MQTQLHSKKKETKGETNEDILSEILLEIPTNRVQKSQAKSDSENEYQFEEDNYAEAKEWAFATANRKENDFIESEGTDEFDPDFKPSQQ